MDLRDVQQSVKQNWHTFRMSRAILKASKPSLFETLMAVTLSLMGPELYLTLRGISVRAALAGAYVTIINLLKRKITTRKLIGLGLVLIVAPLAEILYTFFEYNDRVPMEVWYYESWFWFFMTLGPYFDIVIVCLGVYYFFCDYKDKRAYLLAAPLSRYFAKILWLCQVGSHEEFHAVYHWQYLAYGFLFGVLMIGVIQYLEYIFNHKYLNHISTMRGLCQIADKNDPVQRGFVQTWEKIEAKNY